LLLGLEHVEGGGISPSQTLIRLSRKSALKFRHDRDVAKGG
jgi:hypothetical protein